MGRAADIQVFKSPRREEGSCNSCQDHSGSIVTVIRIGVTSLRVCAECKDILLAKLIK